MPITLDIHDHIATVTIDRPERRNALDAAHYAALSDAFVEIRDNTDIRCAIVTGRGDKAFCAGADIKDWLGQDRLAHDIWLTQQGMLLNRGLEVWKPVIAAVNGACLGGGMTLLFATDIRIAAEEAFFALPEGLRGVIPANGGTQRVLKQMPHAIAMKFLLLGERMSASDAARWGLVNDVVASDKVLPLAYEYATRIAASAPLSMQATKELALRSHDISLADGLRLEQLTQRILLATRDAAEGRRAFLEHRLPEFGGH